MHFHVYIQCRLLLIIVIDSSFCETLTNKALCSITESPMVLMGVGVVVALGLQLKLCLLDKTSSSPKSAGYRTKQIKSHN